MGKASAETYEEKQQAHEVAWKQCQRACNSGDIEGIRVAFQTGRIDKEDAGICVRFHLEEDELDVARCLFEQGVDPNSLPRQTLVNECSLAAIKLLAEFGLDIEKAGHEFLPTNLENRALIDWLLDRGANPNATMTTGSSRIWVDSGGGQYDDTAEVLNEAASRGDIAMFDHLVSRGAIPSRSIALHTASKCKDFTQSKAMITHLVKKYNFDVNADDLCNGLRWFNSLGPSAPESGSPLACAVARENVGAVEALLECDADVENYCGFPGASYDMKCQGIKGLVLRDAIEQGSKEIVKLLLAAGADALAGYTRVVALDDNKVPDEEIARRCEEFIQSLATER